MPTVTFQNMLKIKKQSIDLYYSETMKNNAKMRAVNIVQGQNNTENDELRLKIEKIDFSKKLDRKDLEFIRSNFEYFWDSVSIDKIEAVIDQTYQDPEKRAVAKEAAKLYKSSKEETIEEFKDRILAKHNANVKINVINVDIEKGKVRFTDCCDIT